MTCTRELLISIRRMYWCSYMTTPVKPNVGLCLLKKLPEFLNEWPTLHNQPGRRLQILYAEGKGAAVFDWEVRDGEAVDVSLGTHTEAIARLKLDRVSHPGSWDIGIGELHLERCRFSLCGFDISHPSYDADFSSCEEKCGVRAITVLWHLSICFVGVCMCRCISGIMTTEYWLQQSLFSFHCTHRAETMSFFCYRIGLESVLYTSVCS